ncbi:hypothetical protein [Gottfriedia acidiceleris]|uniref:Uncharacterized protein n=1 Tax=Gottfriedia acidiceleris TaxID=371036 RepID=A0ABY4JNP8_9BACI|nr:hypothetical protein [Gottfriedia acidiceleris]UPM55470.1 hypothetical protein MY490_06410 [Gottfriedia acidiceleris]
MKKTLVALVTGGILLGSSITANAEYKEIVVVKTTNVCKNVKTTKVVKTTKKVKVKKGKKYVWVNVTTSKKIPITKKICQDVKYNETQSISMQSVLDKEIEPIFQDRWYNVDFLENGNGLIERVIIHTELNQFTDEDMDKVIQIVKKELKVNDSQITRGWYEDSYGQKNTNWLDLTR